MKKTISKASSFFGKPIIPGDKSISHRALILGALASGKSEIIDLLESEDVQSTASCLSKLGVVFKTEGKRTIIQGIGDSGLKSPQGVLDCGNSGTTMRVMMGVLAGSSLTATLVGDASLMKRPMKRVAHPLRLMGASLSLTSDDYAPLTIMGRKIHGIEYELKIASAQIKSAIMLAAISGEGRTILRGEIGSRDHTERLLPHFGCEVNVTPQKIEIEGGQKLTGNVLKVPGDPSTAAFWIGAASMIQGAEIEMENISLNPTRIGFIYALQKMGADIETEVTTLSPEPIGKIRVRFKKLTGVVITKDEVPGLIDEIPLIAVLATQCEGVTEVRGAEELRVKESDRIEAVALNLRSMGAKIEVFHDGFRIQGPQKLIGADIKSFHDHRIAMVFSIAGLVAEGETTIHDAECVAVSYPKFYDTLKELTNHEIGERS